MTGSTLERVLAGFDRQLSLSWKEKGLAQQIEYPSATFALINQMVKNGIIQTAFIEGFKEGVKSVVVGCPRSKEERRSFQASECRSDS